MNIPTAIWKYPRGPWDVYVVIGIQIEAQKHMVGSRLEQQVIHKGIPANSDAAGAVCLVCDALPSDGLLYASQIAGFILDKLVAATKYTRPIVLAADHNVVDLRRHYGDSIAVIDAFSNDLTEESAGFTSANDISAAVGDEAKSISTAARPLVVMSLSALAVAYGWKPTLNMLRSVANTPQVSPVICVCHKDMHSLTEFSRLKDMADVYVEASPNRGTSSSQHVLGEIHTIRRSNLSSKVTEDTEFFGRQHGKLFVISNMPTKPDAPAAGERDESKTNEAGQIAVEEVVHVSKPQAAAALITLDDDDPEFDEDEDPDADLDL